CARRQRQHIEAAVKSGHLRRLHLIGELDPLRDTGLARHGVQAVAFRAAAHKDETPLTRKLRGGSDEQIDAFFFNQTASITDREWPVRRARAIGREQNRIDSKLRNDADRTAITFFPPYLRRAVRAGDQMVDMAQNPTLAPHKRRWVATIDILPRKQ